MDLDGLTTSQLNHDDVLFLEKVMIDIRSYVNFLNSTTEKRKVLLFPPVNNFRRFLVHQIVEKTFREWDLGTVSVGNLYARRTVVYPAHLNLSTQVTRVSNLDPPRSVNRRSNNHKLNSCAMSNTPDAKIRKCRKPDIQIYVPRGRRILDASRHDGRSESFIDREIHYLKHTCDDVDSGIKLNPTENLDIESVHNSANELNTTENWDLEIENHSMAVSDKSEICDTESKDNIIDLSSPESRLTDCENNSVVELDSSDVYDTEVEDKSVVELRSPEYRNCNSENNSMVKADTAEVQTIEIEDDNEISAGKCDVQEKVIQVQNLCKPKEEGTCDIKDSQIIDITTDEDVKVITKDEVARDNMSRTKSTSESNCEMKPFEPSENYDPKSVEAETCDRSNAVLITSVKKENGVVSAPLSAAMKASTSTPKPKNGSKKASECDWEELFDDSGQFVDNSLVEELMKTVGKVSIQHATQDYRSYQSVDERTSDGECIIEVHDFPADFKTDDLLNVFAHYRTDQNFQIVWVDDTHALVVFSSPIIADEVLNRELPFVKTRPLKNAIPKSRAKARNYVAAPATRPKTCVSLARRLVSGHLGMKINVTDQQREAEKKLLSDAREKRRQVARQKYDVWESAPSSER